MAGEIDIKTLSDDMTKEEKDSLQDYVNNGCPGLTKIQESDIFQWFKLYMSGKTYSEIANITGAKKDLILYLSYKQKWAEKRLQHYSELIDNLSSKMSQAKLESANTVATIISSLAKYYGIKFNKYIKNGDESVIEKLDSKMLTQYYKSIEVLEKLITPPRKPGDKDPDDPIVPPNPSVHISMGSGKVKQIDENTVEIEDETASKLLMALAEKKKKSEEEED